MHRTLLFCLAALLVPAAGVQAQPVLDDLTLGEHVCGDKLTAEDLKGRTVVLDFWGVT